MLKKLPLIIGICIAILLIPISSAANLDTDVDDGTIEKCEIEPFNGGKEIISFVTGTCDDYSKDIKGLIRHHIELWTNHDFTSFTVRGFKYSSSGEIIFYSCTSTHLIASNFIGILKRITLHSCMVNGIVLGDIEWS